MKQFFLKKINELFGIDTRSLALLRALLALIVLYDFLVLRLPYLNLHYGEWGTYPSVLSSAGTNPDILLWGIHYASPWPFIFLLRDAFPLLPHLILTLGVVSGIFLFVGWRTRIATVVVWLCVMSIQMLNPVVLQGADVLLRLALFIGMFLPWGEAYSVDSALSFHAPKKQRILSAWTMAFLIQIACMYLFAGLEKSAPEWTIHGTAVYYALFIDQLSTPIGEFIRQFPTLMQFLTFSVKTLQAYALFLLFIPYMTIPLRTLGMIALMMMHLSFALSLNLGLFSWVSIVVLCAFIPTPLWDTLTKHARRSFGGLTMYFDAECGFCKKSCYLIRTFLLLPDTLIIPAQTNPDIYKIMTEKDSWVVVDRTGAHTTTYSAGLAIANASPLLYIFVPLLGTAWARRIGERVYRYIANHRKQMCLPKSHQMTLPTSVKRALRLVSITLAVLYIVSVIFWNYAGYVGVRTRIVTHAPLYSDTMWKLGLVQSWRLFAPYPPKDDGWYVVSGTIANGQTINVFDPSLQLPTNTKPKNVSALYPDERMRTFMMNLSRDGYRDIRPYYLSALCRDWSTHHTDDEQLLSVSLVFMHEATLPDYQESEIASEILGSLSCDSKL